MLLELSALIQSALEEVLNVFERLELNGGSYGKGLFVQRF